MVSISNGKNSVQELCSIWRQIVAAKGLTAEYAYRVEKLALKLDSIADKLFIKTVKAHQVLHECRQLTEQFTSELPRSDETALRRLTSLELCLDDLVKTTHEFRIKAG